MKNLLFIGKEFYNESGTMMSSIYEITPNDGYKRTDWGKVKIALREGHEVLIVPATKEEMLPFYEKLREIKSSR